jgi:hypothetical protein
MRSKFYLTICLMAALFLAPTVSTPVHAQFTGKICLTSPGATACPSSPPTLGGNVGSQTRIAVFIQNSDALNGFDITLLANHNILKPAGADLTGTVLPGTTTIIVECVGGVLVLGGRCSPQDTPDTLHLSAASAGMITVAPTTGLLFTAIYNVTGTTPGISVGYQTGCSNSSVSGTTTCVIITNGTPTPVPETVQGATFVTTPIFTITANPSSLTIIHGNSGTSTITIKSVNGFNGTVNLSTSVTPIVHRGPMAALSSSSVSLITGTGSVTLTVSTARNTPLGIYTVAVTGTAGPQTSTINITVTVTR